MRKEKFKIGDTVKCPKGIYKISYFLEVIKNENLYLYNQSIAIQRDFFEKGFQIMIKGVGLYNEDQVELIENKESLTLSDVITRLENLQKWSVASKGVLSEIYFEKNTNGNIISIEDIENLLKELKS